MGAYIENCALRIALLAIRPVYNNSFSGMNNHCVHGHFDPVVLIHHRGPLSVSRMYKQLQHISQACTVVVLFGYDAGSITFPRSEMNVMVLVIRDYIRRAFCKHSNPAKDLTFRCVRSKLYRNLHEGWMYSLSTVKYQLVHFRTTAGCVKPEDLFEGSVCIQSSTAKRRCSIIMDGDGLQRCMQNAIWRRWQWPWAGKHTWPTTPTRRQRNINPFRSRATVTITFAESSTTFRQHFTDNIYVLDCVARIYRSVTPATWSSVSLTLGKRPAERCRRCSWSVVNMATYDNAKDLPSAHLLQPTGSFQSYRTRESALFRTVHSLLKKGVMPRVYIF